MCILDYWGELSLTWGFDICCTCQGSDMAQNKSFLLLNLEHRVEERIHLQLQQFIHLSNGSLYIRKQLNNLMSDQQMISELKRIYVDVT